MSRIAVLKFLLRASSLLPLPLAHGLGAVVGSLLSQLPGQTRTTVRTNLRVCFPDMPERDRRRLERRSYRELGKQMLEMGIIWHADDRRLQRLVSNPDAMDALDALWDPQQGLLLAAPHLGNWELCSLYLNRRFPINNLYRPPREKGLEPLLVEYRQHNGAKSYPATPSGIRSLYKALKAGEMVGILPDQTPEQSGVFAPFFGQPALTMTLLCQMARKSGRPVAFVFSERLPWGRGFRLHVRRGNDDVASDDTEAAAAAMNRDIEACVRQAPAQYQWTYRRFRKTPKGVRKPYKNKGKNKPIPK
ncbi:MAG: lipid A biosynthesis acyltransferase [Ectothiorhodospiraceae bacterium]|nr:lipid A biosynthesis acyltransferase [Ectothiorhodospiraceae bacterium]MCH8504975.1 lipid A biosynthesis acyltransferase [Ectothiorhodospiraceae bacterium]